MLQNKMLESLRLKAKPSLKCIQLIKRLIELL